MKKSILLLFLALLVLFLHQQGSKKGLSDLGESGFRHLLEQEWAREVFDLEPEEAVEVFGDSEKALFL